MSGFIEIVIQIKISVCTSIKSVSHSTSDWTKF